jgi:signal transduction histidine kinase
MTASAGTGSLPARAAALARNAPERLHERAFWIIQFGVLGVTAIHLLAELWAADLLVDVHPALHHIPVVLYLAPIAYASLRYGIEGAFLTGVWCAVLTLPNILAFHSGDLEWLTELIYVGVVIAAGVTMAVPVERERRQRRRAEATSRRLMLLNEIATLTLTADLQRTLDGALASLVGVLDLEAACVATAAPDDPTALLPLAGYAAEPAGQRQIAACVQELTTLREPSHVHAIDDRVMVVPFDTDLPDPSPAGRVSGVLAVQLDAHRSLGADDRQLLVGVGNQLATALANDRLKSLERGRVRSYARLVTWAQEEERKRISRDLHDETAQNLVAIRRNLDTLAARLTPDAHPPELVQLHTLTNQTLAGVRRFSRVLRPPVLDDLGLVSALESLVDELDRRSEVTVELIVEGTPHRLPAESELVLFRIGQAALHNVDRHAHADRATAALCFETHHIRLTVTDDGRGFAPPHEITELAGSGKLGLLGMQERAHLVGADLKITSTPGHGTHVEVEVPR